MNKLLILLYLVSLNTFAEISMHKCTLLPITDSLDGAVSYKVFNEIEEYLSSSDWCEYQSNANLINIFDKYRNNLKSHLKNPKVVRLVSQRLNVGTIIRINIVNQVGGVEVELEILGENGEDIYLSEKVKLNNDSIELINSTLKNWLNLYEKNIPYDGKISGILGDQLTINIGKKQKVKVGNDFIIKRPVRKKRHPLLKQIVEWETEVLAKGKIFSVSEEQALAMVKIYTKEKKLNIGDWVLVDKKSGSFESKVKYPQIKENEFGKLGLLTVTFDLSNSNITTNVSSTGKEAAGFIYGFNLLAELWLTRKYFGMIEVGRRFGNISPEVGTFSKSEIGVTNGKMKFLAGYKYLPMGYFYGPQIDAYTGLTTYSYSPDKSTSDGLGEVEFSGYTLGVRANIPVHKLIRLMVRVEMLMLADYEDVSGVTGGSSSPSTMEIELGVRYSFSPLFSIDGYIERLSSKASTSGTTSEVNFQDTVLKAGATLKF